MSELSIAWTPFEGSESLIFCLIRSLSRMSSDRYRAALSVALNPSRLMNVLQNRGGRSLEFFLYDVLPYNAFPD